MTTHLKGLAVTVLGVLVIVPDSLFVRLIDAEPLVTAFWRALTSGAIILAAILLTRRLGSVRAALATGWPCVVYVLMLGFVSVGFVMAIRNTSVANVVFTFAAIPAFAAVLGRIFLGEPIGRRMVLTTLAVAAGVGVIAYGSRGGGGPSHWSGDLWALAVSAAFAAALVAVRKAKAAPLIPVIPLASIGAALVMLPFVEPWGAVAGQWPLLLGHGAVIGVASCLLAIGPRLISPGEVALVILLESVLAPILVWAVLGEDPGPWALAGGAMVIGALVVSNVVALRRAAA